MLTESQIEYCLAKIREQLTIPPESKYRPNIEGIIAIVKKAIRDGYETKASDDSDSVFEIGLPDRTASILEIGGFETVRALRGATPRELLELRQFGPTMLEDVRACLGERGCRLRSDPPIAVLRNGLANNTKPLTTSPKSASV